jgi:hypothetical protein
VKPLIEISVEQYESLLKYASDTSPLYLRLTNGVKTESNTIAMLCDLDKAERCFAKWQNIFVPALYRKLRKQLDSLNSVTHCRQISPTDKLNAWQKLKQSAHAITVGSARSIPIIRGGMKAAGLRVKLA